MLNLQIVTPDGVTYQSDEVENMSLPTTEGVITILQDHAPLVALLEAGEIEIKKGTHKVSLAVSTGIVHVSTNNTIHIMADTAERAEEIDIARAEEARARAEKMLAEQHDLEDVQFAALMAKIQKEMARIRVGKRRM